MNILPQPRPFVSLQSTITAQGATIPTLFGVQDAQAGATCCPEMYFTHRLDKVAYCTGYASISGHNLTTRQFLTVGC